eukprot:4522846-Pyramimonas_sp.AAC.1
MLTDARKCETKTSSRVTTRGDLAVLRYCQRWRPRPRLTVGFVRQGRRPTRIRAVAPGCPASRVPATRLRMRAPAVCAAT